MGHVAMSGENGSLERLASCAIGRKIYVHINNTNPVLIEDSPQRAAVELPAGTSPMMAWRSACEQPKPVLTSEELEASVAPNRGRALS